jgi:hypothetical protein
VKTSAERRGGGPPRLATPHSRGSRVWPMCHGPTIGSRRAPPQGVVIYLYTVAKDQCVRDADLTVRSTPGKATLSTYPRTYNRTRKHPGLGHLAISRTGTTNQPRISSFGVRSEVFKQRPVKRSDHGPDSHHKYLKLLRERDFELDRDIGRVRPAKCASRCLSMPS